MVEGKLRTSSEVVCSSDIKVTFSCIISLFVFVLASEFIHYFRPLNLKITSNGTWI